MKEIKIAELILMAVSALITAARAIFKFIGCVDKLQTETE